MALLRAALLVPRVRRPVGWITIRSEKLHRIVCEIAPELGLLRVVQGKEQDIIDLSEYGIETGLADPEPQAKRETVTIRR